jgi:hypothetical protein
VDATSLEQKAIDFARRGDFGVEAKQINEELTRLAPANQGAWTRLARCCIELGLLDDANAALETVLTVNPQNTIARSLLQEAIRRELRAAGPDDGKSTKKAKSTRAKGTKGTKRAKGVPPRGGFGRPQFAALGQLAPASAVESLGPAIEALLMAVSERPFAAKVVEARNRAGQAGSKLYRRNSFYPGGPGHIFAFQHGGRWEPQIHLGFYAAPHWGRDAVSAGIGFNMSAAGASADKEAGQELVLQYFETFQQLVGSAWRSLLADWMMANGGFVQMGSGRPPATDLLPAQAVDALTSVRNGADTEWVFVGRWLFLDRADHAEILADHPQLVKWIEQTFVDLLPLWTSVYREA